MKIAITTTTFGKDAAGPLEILKKGGCEVTMNPYGRKLEPAEVLKLCAGAEGIIAGTETINGAVMENLHGLKVISRCGAGLDNIDIKTADKLGIKICGTPNAPTRAVSELAIGLILNLLRKINRMDSGIRRGRWEKLTGSLLCGKKAGIIGFGKIGRTTGRLLDMLGCEVAYADPFVKDGISGFKRLPLKKILRWADIITIHVAGADKILGGRELRAMKRGAWLVNVSRGGVVDERSLYRCLKEGRIAGAAMDVFEQEPYKGPLRGLRNVILTPHIGSYAREARIRMETEAVENLVKALKIKKARGKI